MKNYSSWLTPWEVHFTSLFCRGRLRNEQGFIYNACIRPLISAHYIICLVIFSMLLPLWLVKKGKRVGKHNTEPWLNKPLFNEVLDITNDTLCLSQNYHKMYGIEPWYNEFLDIANIIRKAKHKIYLDITNYNVNMQQKINAEEINSQQIL